MALIFFRHKKDADKCISKFLYLPKYILLFSVHFIFRSDFNNAVIISVGFKTILTGNVCVPILGFVFWHAVFSNYSR